MNVEVPLTATEHVTDVSVAAGGSLRSSGRTCGEAGFT